MMQSSRPGHGLKDPRGQILHPWFCPWARKSSLGLRLEGPGLALGLGVESLGLGLSILALTASVCISSLVLAG